MEIGACPLTEPEALCSGFEEKRVEGEEEGQAATAETTVGSETGGKSVGKVQLHCGARPGAARAKLRAGFYAFLSALQEV